MPMAFCFFALCCHRMLTTVTCLMLASVMTDRPATQDRVHQQLAVHALLTLITLMKHSRTGHLQSHRMDTCTIITSMSVFMIERRTTQPHMRCVCTTTFSAGLGPHAVFCVIHFVCIFLRMIYMRGVLSHSSAAENAHALEGLACRSG